MSKELLTHSRMQSFKLCRKKHEWAYIHGLRKDYDSKALRMGSAGHEGLDVLKKTGDVEAAVHAVEDIYFNRPDAVDEWDWLIERETVSCLVAAYHWRWQEQPLEIIASEQAFQIPLRNPSTGASSRNWDLAGKIDGIVQEGNRKLVLEHKFISDDLDPNSDYWRRLVIDTQITIYTYAGRELKHDTSGVLYDLIRKPTIRPSQVALLDDDGLKMVVDENGERVFAKTGKPRQTGDKKQGYTLLTRNMTVEEWQAKLMCDIELRPDWYFQRREVARLDDDIAQMQREVWDVQKAISDATKKHAHYKTVNLGSCAYCAYFGLCTSHVKYDGNPVEGFVKLLDIHPELGG